MADFKRVKDDVQVAMATDSPNKGLHDSSRVHVFYVDLAGESAMRLLNGLDCRRLHLI